MKTAIEIANDLIAEQNANRKPVVSWNWLYSVALILAEAVIKLTEETKQLKSVNVIYETYFEINKLLGG